MSVETKKREREAGQGDHNPIHIYLTPQRPARPGDVALCGHVKQAPTRYFTPGIHRPGRQTCAVCLDAAGMAW